MEDHISCASGIEFDLNFESISLRTVETVVVPNPLTSRDEIVVTIDWIIEFGDLDSISVVGVDYV